MKILSRSLILLILITGVLVGCASGESDSSSGTDKEKGEGSNLDGKKYNIIGEEVFTDFVEERYDGLEIKFISAGYVSQIPEELHERYFIVDSFDHLLVELEITNTTDRPISFYPINLTSKPVDDWSDDEELSDSFINTATDIHLKDNDDDEFDEQMNFLEKYKLLANAEHTHWPQSTVRGLHLISFREEDVSGNVFLHSNTLEGELMFELEPIEESWYFSDVGFSVDYENYDDEYDKYH
ncbi:hypothetical protein [Gracilibacillus kekensis]|uniref:Uncharacterized protein n=1 Tax=Gracilibacillus kekensis TaxID=1027249 RepID=A0A1M7QJX0_9BACI|nr:hypothetical protein [Gracilibacillus kekensis]SHN31133.1 hypothetical protein SAMN05216179_3241 [Gracilibacillus kekensis]